MSNRYFKNQFVQSHEGKVVSVEGILPITGALGLPVDALAIPGLSASREGAGVYRFQCVQADNVTGDSFPKLLSVNVSHFVSSSQASTDASRAINAMRGKLLSVFTTSSLGPRVTGSQVPSTDMRNVGGFYVGLMDTTGSLSNPVSGSAAATSLQYFVINAKFRNSSQGR